MLPDFDRVDRIGEFWAYPESRTFAELLIDCEEDRTLLEHDRRPFVARRLVERERERTLGVRVERRQTRRPGRGPIARRLPTMGVTVRSARPEDAEALAGSLEARLIPPGSAFLNGTWFWSRR